QRRAHALEPIRARAFHEHRDAGLERVARFGDERIEICEPSPLRSECFYRVARAFADREQAFDARFARITTDFRVQLVGAVAELLHLAEHEPTRTAEAAERIQARLQRAGIRVV